jgi:hypothetical protein
MAIGRVNAAGGAGLNFKVVGGTVQPTGRENLIWVNTDTEVADWVFSAAQPDGVEGRVWFITGTSSGTAFNAVKKNGLWVYPSNCKQYVSGAWVDKAAKTYQNGEWKDWETSLYDQGTVSALGTGLNSNSCNWYTGTTYYDIANIQRGADYIRFYSSDTYSHGIAIWTTSKVDLTNFTSLKAYVSQATSNVANKAYFYLYASSTLPSNTSSYSSRVAAAATALANGIGTITTDLSAVTGSYYVILGYAQSGYSSTVTADGRVNKIWLK